MEANQIDFGLKIHIYNLATLYFHVKSADGVFDVSYDKSIQIALTFELWTNLFVAYVKYTISCAGYQ